MKSIKIHLVLSVLVLGLVSNSFSKIPAPTHANVAYDTHERTVLDFWQAEGEGARPLLVYIHGGGWMKGDKRAMKHADVYLKEGISVAAVNYRLVPENPLPAPVHDAARAVQFLRSKANEWQIDTNNVVLSGGSAGGCSSLWIACHDDLAKPDSNDPVERESSRVQGAAVLSAQTSIDPKVIEPWIGPKVFLSMIYKAVGEDTLESMQANYAQHEAAYEAFSPINHLSQDDPPLFLEYPDRPEFMALPPTSFNYGIHHGMFGIKFKEQSAAVGHNKVELQIKDHDESPNYANVDDFIFKTLLGKQAVSVAKAQAADAPQPSTVIPVPSQLKKFMPKRHNAKLEQARTSQVDLVMIGDSITHNWERMGNYESTFDGRNLLNLGFAGDRTQNVLWRIQHGALDGITPKLVTLMIGTNHMHLPKKGYTPDTPEDIFTGIQAVVAEIRARVPDSKLIVFSVFPRGPESAQQRVNAVNAMLPQLADQKQIFHVNINHAFLGEDGALNKALYKGDQLHFNHQGYEAWARVLVPLLEDAALKDTSVSSAIETTKVACIGDSITFGHGINDRETNSYPAQLGALLGDGYQVKNFGVSGSTMLKQGNKPYWKQAQYQAAQDFEPNIVVIKLGTNDMKARNWKFKADYKADYIDMIRTFQGLPSQPTVMICYPAPVFRTKGDFKDSIVRQELIPLVDAVSHDAGVRVINLYQPLADQPALSRDGLHPNVAGATVIAETVATAILGKTSPQLAMPRSAQTETNTSHSGISQEAFIEGKRTNIEKRGRTFTEAVEAQFVDFFEQADVNRDGIMTRAELDAESLKRKNARAGGAPRSEQSNSKSSAASPWDGKKSSFHGFDQYDFKFEGNACKVVVPKTVADGKPWVWRARFWGHEPQFDIAMLERGYHVVYCHVGGLFGNTAAVKRWNAFYDYLRFEHLFADRVVLEGMSRGGLIIYNWAAANPEKVAAIYADAPVMDFKSWPGGKGTGKGAAGGWRACLQAYGFSEAEALAYQGNPLDNLTPLAKAGIPIIHVVGDVDDVVPVAENTAIAEARYKKLGGVFEVIHKPEVGHHPHSLKDPQPIIDFVLKHTAATGEVTAETIVSDRNFILRGSYQNSRIEFERHQRGHVAFIGGSITEMEGYRPKVCTMLETRFPETEFTFTQAGISSTCSDTGAFRLQQDVLSQGPLDLLFVEFAVNDDQDAARTYSDALRGMEGIIAQARRHNPKVDIVMTFFVNQNILAQLQRGEMAPSIAAHGKVAEHYAISVNHLAQELADQIGAGKMTWNDFGGVHPNDFGNTMCATMIGNALLTEWSKPLPADATAKAHPVVPLIDDKSYARGRLLPFEDVQTDSHWKVGVPDWKQESRAKVRAGFLDLPFIYTSKAGARLSIDFTGTAIGAYLLAGPDAGIIRCTVDGQQTKEIDTLFRYNFNYPMTVMFFNELAEGAHTLELEILENRSGRSKPGGTALRVIGFTAN